MVDARKRVCGVWTFSIAKNHAITKAKKRYLARRGRRKGDILACPDGAKIRKFWDGFVSSARNGQ
jgi:hypothetical protein